MSFVNGKQTLFHYLACYEIVLVFHQKFPCTFTCIIYMLTILLILSVVFQEST